MINFILTWLSFLGGFLIREGMAFTTRRNNEKVSLRYYWSLSKNRWNVIINAVIGLVMMWGRSELITLSQSAYITKSWPIVASIGQVLMLAPYITALLIGLFGAFMVRWVITTVDQRWGKSAQKRKAEGTEPMVMGD